MPETLWTSLPDWAIVFGLIALFSILSTALVVMVRMDINGPAEWLRPSTWWVVTVPLFAGSIAVSAVKFGEDKPIGGFILLSLGLLAAIVGILAVRWAIESGDYHRKSR